MNIPIGVVTCVVKGNVFNSPWNIRRFNVDYLDIQCKCKREKRRMELCQKLFYSNSSGVESKH